MIFHQRKNKKIYWQLHEAGLINQVMSVEIGAGVSFMEKSPIHFYGINFNNNKKIHPSGIIPDERRKLYVGSETPKIFDLLDIPNDIKYSFGPDSNVSKEEKSSCLELNDILKYYYKCADGPNEKEFSDGRVAIPLRSNSNINFVKFAFGFYSRFFFNRPKELDCFFSRLTFKKPYLDLAENIANNLGKFRGMHIRLTDHADKYDHSPENLSKSQDHFKDKSLNLIISTDDKHTIIEKTSIKGQFIDDIITHKYSREFMALPHHDEVVFGLMSLLTMSYAEEFVGTPGSTFSNYIHRLRINRGLDDNFYCIKAGKHFDDDKQNGPFSWNGNRNHTNTKSWWQEWKECKLCVTKS
jgi:hypothetical protein